MRNDHSGFTHSARCGGSTQAVCPPSGTEPTMLKVPFTDVLWLEIVPGSAFSCTGHHPILAGMNESGVCEYVARVPAYRPGKFDKWGYPCTVVEGATSVQYRDDDGTVRVTRRFDVLALRFDPRDSDESGMSLSKDERTGTLVWTGLSPAVLARMK